MDEPPRPSTEIPEDLRDVLTDDIIPLLPMIFEQAIASLSPEHIARLAQARDEGNVALGADVAMNADPEIQEAFLQNVWAMLSQPPEYREDSILCMRAIQGYQGTGHRRLLDEAIERLERIRGHPVFEADHDQARVIVLSNSVACYLWRHEITGDESDLDLTLSLIESVVAETPDDHPLRPGRLQNRASALAMRYERFGNGADLREAVANLREAVAETPDLSPYLPSYLEVPSIGHGLVAGRPSQR